MQNRAGRNAMENLPPKFDKIIPYELAGFFGRSKLQKFWRTTRTSYVLYPLIRLFPKATRQEHVICDAGCGPGIVDLFFARRGFKIKGIDILKPFITFARQMFEKKRLPGTFLVADITTQSPVFDENGCDAVICIDAIEHFKDPAKAINNFKKILGNHGHVLLTTPNFGNPLFSIIERLWDIVGRTPGWKTMHITRLGLQEYRNLFTNAGFHLEQSGTFFLVSPIVGIFSPRLARFASRFEREILARFPIGLMLFLHASIVD
jgi:2-polyprenyl-3-methyl-5-hydroxy-6-metoxy-1,4-benzoquinol methylase